MAEFGPEPIVSSLACDLQVPSNDPSSFSFHMVHSSELSDMNFATRSSSTCTIQLNFFVSESLQKNMFFFFSCLSKIF